MTPTPTGQVIPTASGRDLVLERILPGSIDDAWASITESDRLARWFCTWTGEARVGATVELSLVAEEGDATSQAEITACEPPKSRSQLRRMLSNTGRVSATELLIAFSTSDEAFCCSSASRVSLKSRAFWIAITAWSAKVFSSASSLALNGFTT